MMKKVVLLCSVIVLGLLISSIDTGRVFAAGAVTTAQCSYKKFKVTAYYSPLPGQSFYYKPNLQKEIRLNGRGTNGASGAPVFNGMIAAPSSYAFGTKIYFPGWGVGQVEDRGGAIVHEGERNEQYDRIDIWAGKGEEGLRRALSFGVQYLDAYVCPSYAVQSTIGFDYNQFPSYSDFFERMIWIMSLEPGREDMFVKSLQRYLEALGYLDDTSVTGKYGRLTKAAVCLFQQRHIGLPAQHESCGWFGPQTRTAMKHLVKRKGVYLTPLDATVETHSYAGQVSAGSYGPGLGTVGSSPAQPSIVNEASLAAMSPTERFNHHLFTDGEFATYAFANPFTLGAKSKEVRILQRKLAWLGHYTHDEITGEYDVYTIQALFRFQKEKGILTGNEDPSLFGYFGPATRRALNSL